MSGEAKLGIKPGRERYLTVAKEKEFVNFLLKYTQMGYAHTRKQVIVIVQETKKEQNW